FYAQFTIDDSVTDHSNADDVNRGFFSDFLIDLVIARDPSNVGTWDPAEAGLWALPYEVATLSDITGYQVSTGVSWETPFAPVTFNGVPAYLPVVEILLSATINDTGTGQTWAEQVSDLGPAGWLIAWHDGEDQGCVTFSVHNFGEGPHPELLP